MMPVPPVAALPETSTGPWKPTWSPGHTGSGLPPVTVVHDPDDDYAFMAAALAAHAPALGRITVHPTPVASAPASLAHDLLRSLGKEGIVVNDSPGFVSNRVLMLTINEAIFLVQEGVASAEDVDKIFKQCFGHKMGPLETGDLIGLDTILLSLEVLCEQFGDSKFRPSPLLRKMVHAGLYGRKSGRGFYEYA